MDTELFMECEEEELEPWQQVDDSVEEDDMDFMDGYGEPVEDSRSPPPAPETPPPRTPSPVPPAPTVSSHVHIISSSVAPPPPRHPVASPAPPPAPAPAPPLMAQAPPIFLTQTTGGAFLLPAAPGTGNARPILLATQGFPMQTMMNHGTPLLLNLQPGQTVQPLTLIQSPTLGQLVRPSVGVSPILPQGQAVQTRPTPVSSGHAQPGSAFTAMRLPATLTIRTSTPGPVNLQMTQLSGTNSLKLAVSPALPSGSANGVTRFTPIRSAPGPGPGLGPGPTSSSMTSPLTPDPSRVVMSVEEFYYGTFQGDLSLRRPHPLGIKTSTFTCQICTHLAENNLRLMQHMLQHSELISGGGDDRKCCRFCYRQFSSPAQLQSHQDLVHGSTLSPALCRICEWAFENEPAFLNHMKSNHKPGEMPYVCQVCSYRSSFYSDVLQHFASFHRDSRFLLCVFCLKVTRNPASYQQHLLRHQINQAFHCNRCRLQFVFLKDKMQHKLENHRSFRRPAKLEGLPPGSKVTIRTYGKSRPLVTTAGSRLLQSPAFIVQPIIIKTELKTFPLQRNAAVNKSPRSPTKRLLRGHNRSWSCNRLLCLECGTDASDFSSHYPTYVHCLLCPYSSCCSRAYATHMIHHHVPRSEDRLVPLHRRPPPCPFLLRCSQCDFRPQTADHMAAHLLVHPEHHSAICCSRTFVEPDIQFCYSEDQEPDHSKDFPDPSWRSADSWKAPVESQESSIVPFTETSGPNHYLSKNSDAIDFFNLVFPAELIKLITDETNAHAKTSRFLGSCCPGWFPVTTHEIRGFIGLVVLMGIQNLPDPQHYWSWSHYDNSYTFYRAMSFKRFKQIATNIRMGSFATDEYRGTGDTSDPLHIFRPMLDILGRAMWDAYRPNCCLTIDRALLPSLEEGNPKTQPQVWLLCDSKSGYCHRFFIQVVENVIQAPGFTVVPELVKGLEDKHHQLFLASSLTSVPLMQKLLDQGIYASSSFPPPNPILPRELWDEGRLEKPGDFLQRQYGPLLATRWRDTKEMGCLATNAAPGEPDTVWRRSQTKVGGLDPIDRPMAFRLLQENMRGVDICKQLLACNPLGGIPQDRHWRSLFWFLVNLSIVNAFILLRESRKENPPAWVQDGLFTQVNFRKRLGNQLAKCAQKYFETMEIASARKTRVEVAGEAVKQRHRMSKISCISKRCKNCNKNNVRHESVYGCVICKVNLCKQPSCFWEYHGLSPLNKGSTKVGFLKDTISGAMEVDKIEGNVDEDMAPVEDTDFSDEEKLDDLDAAEETAFKEGLNKDVKRPVSLSPSTTNDQLASRDREDVLTARQLRIGLVALCGGLRQASRVFSTDTRLIQSWLKEAQKHLKQTEPQHKVDVGGEERLVEWVLSMREQQLPITESNLFHKASTLKKKGGFADSFRISYDWAVSFLLLHRLGVRAVGRCTSLLHSLPPSLEPKVKSFREFTQNVFQVHGLTESSVAAMDELCLFLDVRLAQDESQRSEALELSGSVPLVTVFLAALADGTVLKSLVLASRDLEQKARPGFIILGTAPDLLSAEEVLDLWTKQVWLPHVSGPAQPRKSMLVLDRHREHMGDRFLASISGSGTLPAVIPGGCSVLLQPLEVCVKPVLQRYLISRWSTFTRRNPKELEEASPQQLLTNVAQLLVDWLEEALTHLNKVPQLWRKSFNLTGLLRKTEEEEKKVTSEKPEKIQSDLMKMLTEILMDAETLQVDSSDLLELEDKEDEGDRQQGRQEPETPEDKQEPETSEDKQQEPETSEDKQQEPETSEDKQQEPETSEDKQQEPETLEDKQQPETLEDKQQPETSEDKQQEPQTLEDKQQEPETSEDKQQEPETSEDKQQEPETLEDKQQPETLEDKQQPETSEDKQQEPEILEDKQQEPETSEEGQEDNNKEKEAGDRQEMKEEGRTEDTENEVEETEKDGEEDRMNCGEKEETKTLEEDSEEEGEKLTEEDIRERRETRIVIGEDVGDEWKITMKS